VSAYSAPLPSTRRATGGLAHEWLGRPIPWIVLAACAGVMLDAVANAFGRTGQSGGQILFWTAAVVVILPAALALLAYGLSSNERAGVVVIAGLALYAFKVLQNPFGFTYADEWSHLHNLQSILSTGKLFGSNSILPITSRYPGVESFAAAIARAGGLSAFAAGVTAIAAARVMIMLGLYLLYARLTGSARAAGLASLFYAGTPTYLFWAGQFSYESLALPLAIVAGFALIRWLRSPVGLPRRRWAAVILSLDAGIVVTHHITSYVFFGLLFGVCAIHLLWRRRRGAPWAMMAGVGLMTAAWLTFAANATVGYISGPLGSAYKQVLQTVDQASGPRTLFVSNGSVEQTSHLEGDIAIFGTLLIALAIYAGLHVMRRDLRHNPVILLLGLAAVGYLGTLPLRLVSAAWEAANRAGDFLFAGAALTAALGLISLMGGPARENVRRKLLVCGVVLMVFLAGVVAGWPTSLRLARPAEVVSGGRTLVPEVVAAARWSGAMLGSAHRVGAQEADARIFLDDARQTAYAGTGPDIQDLLNNTSLQPWQRNLLGSLQVDLIVSDLREISSDNTAGYFFDVGAPRLAAPPTQTKFEVPGVDLIYDAGTLKLFDVRALWGAAR
jgi:hypothetical protein